MAIIYDLKFILSIKELYKECPFIEKIEVKKPPKNKNNKWNRGEFLVTEPLIRSDNAWKSNDSSNDSDNEIVLKNVISILNKLSKDNFDSLTKKLIEIDINNQKLVQQVIEIIFKKAINEPHFGEVYAELCNQLENKNYCDGKINFKREILTQCQKEFEKEKEQNDVSVLIKLKMEYLGNIKFVGELFKKDMISNAIIFQCMRKLINKIDKNDKNDKNDNIECICKLITTIGETVDKNKQNSNLLNPYFETLTIISNDSKNDFRYRFMIKDVIDLRKNKWVARIKQAKVMTKKEIREEYNKCSF